MLSGPSCLLPWFRGGFPGVCMAHTRSPFEHKCWGPMAAAVLSSSMAWRRGHPRAHLSYELADSNGGGDFQDPCAKRSRS
jgi:hypothetical protein